LLRLIKFELSRALGPAVNSPVRIEIRGKDEFWGRAFHVEWEHQFPDRRLTADGEHFIAEREWFEDLDRVGSQTFCKIVVAPENPLRRRWMSSLIGRRRVY
jgi:hypothetical protein